MDDSFYPTDRFENGISCGYCQRELDQPSLSNSMLRATRDHIWPRKLRHCAAPNAPVRIWSCFVCNQLKGDMPPRAWCHFMRETPHWWTTPSLDRYLDTFKRYYDSLEPTTMLAVAVVAGIAFARRIYSNLAAFPHAFEDDLENSTVSAEPPYILSHYFLAILATRDRLDLYSPLLQQFGQDPEAAADTQIAGAL